MQVKVDLVDGEGEVSEVDGDEDLPAVFYVAEGARRGFGVAGANEDGVEDGLCPSSRLASQHLYVAW